MATPLVTYLRLQRALDRDVLASLRAASASVDSELRRLQGRVGIGNEMRTTQLAASQAAINREMAQHWTRVGNLTAAHQANAAADAAEEAFRASAALSSVFDPEDLDYMTRSVRASAQQGLSTAMERVSGSSYVPLAESVYDNAALTSGKIDEIITSAITRGASAAELARDVKGFINPNTPGGVRYASMRLGRTELNNAFHASQVRQAQESPWTTAVKWNLSGSHPVPDECNQYAESSHFKGGGEGEFKPDEVPSKPHPNCLCYMTTVDVDRDEFIRQFETGQYDEYLQREFDLAPENMSGLTGSVRTPAPGPGEPFTLNKLEGTREDPVIATASPTALRKYTTPTQHLPPAVRQTDDGWGDALAYLEDPNSSISVSRVDHWREVMRSGGDVPPMLVTDGGMVKDGHHRGLAALLEEFNLGLRTSDGSLPRFVKKVLESEV